MKDRLVQCNCTLDLNVVVNAFHRNRRGGKKFTNFKPIEVSVGPVKISHDMPYDLARRVVQWLERKRLLDDEEWRDENDRIVNRR